MVKVAFEVVVKAAQHRKQERQHAKTARYYIRQKMYAEAIRSLAWALQQETAADLKSRPSKVRRGGKRG